jgi:putative transcriptional regulator
MARISRKRPRRIGSARASSFLDGQLLIAMPVITDRRFQRSVVYMCAHTDDGAMGLIINQRAPHMAYPDLLERLGILTAETAGIAPDLSQRAVHVGGPVETGRGFVLHSSDYTSTDSTLQIDAGVSLTATVDILRDIAVGTGPDRSILALGYASWGAGQLESEMAANGWLHCPADPDLVFSTDLDGKYRLALAKLGIELAHLVTEAGHA